VSIHHLGLRQGTHSYCEARSVSVSVLSLRRSGVAGLRRIVPCVLCHSAEGFTSGVCKIVHSGDPVALSINLTLLSSIGRINDAIGCAVMCQPQLFQIINDQEKLSWADSAHRLGT
jgi:hypothetical protein